MKKFKFELAQVLEFRNFEKQQAEGELAKAIAVETQIKDQLQIIAVQYNDLKNRMKGSLNFDDVLASISRLSNRVSGKQTKKACGQIRELMATYQDNATMITSGIYEKGNSPVIDKAIDKHEAIEEFLKQEIEEHCTMEDTLNKLSQLAEIEIPEEEYSEQPGLIKPVEESAEQKAVDSE